MSQSQYLEELSRLAAEMRVFDQSHPHLLEQNHRLMESIAELKKQVLQLTKDVQEMKLQQTKTLNPTPAVPAPAIHVPAPATAMPILATPTQAPSRGFISTPERGIENVTPPVTTPGLSPLAGTPTKPLGTAEPSKVSPQPQGMVKQDTSDRQRLAVMAASAAAGGGSSASVPTAAASQPKTKFTGFTPSPASATSKPSQTFSTFSFSPNTIKPSPSLAKPATTSSSSPSPFASFSFSMSTTSASSTSTISSAGVFKPASSTKGTLQPPAGGSPAVFGKTDLTQDARSSSPGYPGFYASPKALPVTPSHGDQMVPSTRKPGQSPLAKDAASPKVPDTPKSVSFKAEVEDDDVIFISMTEPSPEQRTRAEKLLLPEGFYLYEDAPPCKGCIGCREDIDIDSLYQKDGDGKGSAPAVRPKEPASVFGAAGASSAAFGCLSSSSPGGSLFGGGDTGGGISFATLAANQSERFGQPFGKKASHKPFSFANAGAPVFGGSESRGNDDGESHRGDEEYDPHYEPIVSLPDIGSISTGEEDEEEMFCHRAKLFLFDRDTKAWKERGVGDIKILRNPKTGSARILMRRDQILKLCANHWITADMVLKPMMASETAWIWFAVDFSEEEAMNEQLAVKFRHAENSKRFKEAFLEAQELLGVKDEEKNEETEEVINDDVIFIPMTEPSPEQRARAEKLMLPGGFYLYEDAPSCKGCIGCSEDLDIDSLYQKDGDDKGSAPAVRSKASHKPFSFANAGAPVFGGSESRGNDDGESHRGDEEYDPHYEPIVSLPDIGSISTGEEDEEEMFCHRAKLFRFDRDTKAWKERGVGDIKILRNPKTGSARILMRRDQILKLCANHWITADMVLKPMMASETAWIWCAVDFLDEEAKNEQLAVKFKHAEDSKRFKEAFLEAQELLGVKVEEENNEETEEVISKASANLKVKMANKPGSWDCDACYSNNPSQTTSCLACGGPKPGAKAVPSSTMKGASAGASAPVASSTLGAKFGKKPGSWDCDTCYTNNAATSSACVACTTTKPGSDPKPSTGAGASAGAIGGAFILSSGFTFGAKPSGANAGFGFGGAQTSAAGSTTGSGATFKVPAGLSFTGKSSASESSAPDSTTTDGATGAAFTVPSGFSFSSSQSPSSKGSILGAKKDDTQKPKETDAKAASTGFLFGGVDTAKAAPSTSSGATTTGGTVVTDKFTFGTHMPQFSFGVKDKPKSNAGFSFGSTPTKLDAEETKEGYPFSSALKTTESKTPSVIEANPQLTSLLLENDKSSMGKEASANLKAKMANKPGSWDCDACYSNNPSKTTSCLACGGPKPGVKAVPSSTTKGASAGASAPVASSTLGAKFGKKPGSWDCDTCYTNNAATSSACVACTTTKPGSDPKPSTGAGASAGAIGGAFILSSGFTFGAKPSGANAGFGFGGAQTSAAGSTTGSGATFKVPAGLSFTGKSSASESSAPDSTTTDGATGAAFTVPSGFSFSSSQSPSSTGSILGAKKDDTQKPKETDAKAASTGFLFGGVDTAKAAPSTSSGATTTGGTVVTDKFTFGTHMPQFSFGVKDKPKSNAGFSFGSTPTKLDAEETKEGYPFSSALKTTESKTPSVTEANPQLTSLLLENDKSSMGKEASANLKAKMANKPGSWDCDACYSNNPSKTTSCLACGGPKPGVKAVPSSTTKGASAGASAPVASSTLGAKFGKKPGSWDCDTCYTNNAATSSACVACTTTKPGSDPKPSSGATGTEKASRTEANPQLTRLLLGNDQFSVGKEASANLRAKFANKPRSWDYDACYSNNSAETSSRLACGGPNTSFTNSAQGAKFGRKPGSWDCDTCYTNNAAEFSVCAACTTRKPGSDPKPFTGASAGAVGGAFAVPSGLTFDANPRGARGFVLGGAQTSTARSTTGSDAGFNFSGKSSASNGSTPESMTTDDAAFKLPSGFSFSSQLPASTVFTFCAKKEDMHCYDGGHRRSNTKPSTKAASTRFAPCVMKNNILKIKKRVGATKAPSGGFPFGGSNKPSGKATSTRFVRDAMKDNTQKLKENIKFSHRSKLYRYDGESKHWKEGGVGDIKVLYNSEDHSYRIVMRELVCTNHYITSSMALQPMSGSDCAWVWHAMDSADGEPTSEQLAIKFKDPSIAASFKEKFEEAQAKIRLQECSGNEIS